MNQIRTVMRHCTETTAFDADVNALLADGWNLRKREIRKLPGELSESFNSTAFCVLYAELDKQIPCFEEITI